MLVNETFYSIQGESTFMGRPCLFIRLVGCNLKCDYCDTQYAADPEHPDFKKFEMSVPELIDLCQKSPAEVVEITGGEPLLQADEVLPLCVELVKFKKAVLIETNGTLSIRRFHTAPANFHMIMDIKTPSSGMEERTFWENLTKHKNKKTQFKFVIGSENDFQFAKDICLEYNLENGDNEILVSPAFGQIDLKELASWVLTDMPYARMQVQLHKLVWEPLTRGV